MAASLTPEQQRRMAHWVTSAVSLHGVAEEGVTAATVVSDALDALGVDCVVAPVAAIVRDDATPSVRMFGRAAFEHEGAPWDELRDSGDHAVAVSEGAGLVLDAAFERFGTLAPFLVATLDEPLEGPGARSERTLQAGSATVTYLTVDGEVDVADETRALMLAQGLEVAGVGAHVNFDQDALVMTGRRLFPSWTHLKNALDDVYGDAATRLAAFRTARSAHLAGLGYPWSLEDPYLAPAATVGEAA